MSNSAKGMLAFSEDIGNLKHLERRGWHLRGIPNPERITGHMYRMAMMAMALDPIDGCDMDKVIKMCLIHDLPECRVGDITPHCGVDTKAKHKMEADAMVSITQPLASHKAKRLLAIYNEYELRKSTESRLVKELDSLDLLLQAFEYEKRIYLKCGKLPPIEEFYENSPKVFTFPELAEIYSQMVTNRKEFFQKINAHSNGGTPVPSLTENANHEPFSDKNRLPDNGYPNLYPEPEALP